MLDTIKRNALIHSGDKVVVGLSGGPDSLAMTHALIGLSEKLNISLVAVHVNHQFRGAFADEDEAFVCAFCQQYNIPCYSFRIDVASLSKEKGTSFEEMGRIVRYEKFEQVKTLTGANKIAIAQNKNDVIETFFINLFRGSGIDGLASIDYMREDLFIRPMLDIDRACIEGYCSHHQLSARRDHTNDENDYVRNKIRNSFLPYIRNTFNASIDESIAKTVTIMKAEKSFWTHHQQALFTRICTFDKGVIRVKLNLFDDLQEAEKNQLIRYSIKMIRGNLTNLNYETIVRITKLNRTGAICKIDENLIAKRSYDELIISEGIHINNRENIEQPKLFTKIVDISEQAQYVMNNSCIAIDAESVKGNLSIRTRKEGDRFIPLGMKGHKKLKEFFIDEKIPADKRDSIYLVCDEEKIVWVQDLRMNDACKITQNTKNIIIMSFQELVERR